jgi:cystathionine gamma-synthase
MASEQDFSKSDIAQWGAATQSVHAGATRPQAFHALTEGIYPTATYTFVDTAAVCDYQASRLVGTPTRVEYGRYGNPTVQAAEQRLAALEGANECVLFSSGMAAITTTLLALLRSGDHLIMTSDSYRRTRIFCADFLSRYGVSTTFVNPNDWDAVHAAVRPETRLIFSESPTNPYLRCLDLVQLVQIARQYNLITLVDSTFATPINQRPLTFGVDLVLHSATKYLGGHNDMLAGALLGSSILVANVRQHLGMLGAVSDPHSAYLLLRGIKTLGIRIAQQNSNALKIAQFLAQHPKVEEVWYPALPNHPDHAIATAQMQGFGGVVSFSVQGDLDSASRVIDAARLPQIAPSLGGIESLIEQPALVSYYDLTSAQRQAIGMRDNLIRLAVGIEDAADLIADLDQALQHAD